MRHVWVLLQLILFRSFLHVLRKTYKYHILFAILCGGTWLLSLSAILQTKIPNIEDIAEELMTRLERRWSSDFTIK